MIAFGVCTALGQDASCGGVMPPCGSCAGAFETPLVMNADPGLELTMVPRLIPEPAGLPLLLGLAMLGLVQPCARRAARWPGRRRYSTTMRGPAGGAPIRCRHLAHTRAAIAA